MSSRDLNQNNLVRYTGLVNLQDRYALLNHGPLTLWLTGLSGAGKSTLAYALEKELIFKGYACCVLDGDNVRHGLNSDLGFSQADRAENIRRVAEVAKLMNDAGLIVISSFISPFEKDRLIASSIIGFERFFEVYISTSIGECERRDPKNLYKKARSGELHEFTGVSSPYEPPVNPEMVIDTTGNSVKTCIELMAALVFKKSTKVANHGR